MKRMRLGATLLMLSSLCLFAACAGNGCNSIFPEKASAYDVAWIETGGSKAISVTFPYETTEYDKYLQSIPTNDYFSFFVRDAATKKKVAAACAHEKVGDVFEGSCIAQGDDLAGAQKIELIAFRKNFTEEKAEEEACKAAKFVIACLKDCPSDYQSLEKIDEAYAAVDWKGGEPCSDPEDADKEICSQLESMGCAGASKEDCFELTKLKLQLGFVNSNEVHTSPKLSLVGVKTIVADCAFGSADPSCAEPALDCEQDPTAEGCGDAGDGQGDDLPTSFEDKGGVGDDSGDSGGEDMAPGSAGDCALMPHAAVDPLVFLLLGGALLPLVGRRRGQS